MVDKRIFSAACFVNYKFTSSFFNPAVSPSVFNGRQADLSKSAKTNDSDMMTTIAVRRHSKQMTVDDNYCPPLASCVVIPFISQMNEYQY